LDRSSSRLSLVVLCLLAVAGVSRAQFVSATSEEKDGSDQTGLGEFAFDAYRALAADNEGKNVFCSPYSLSNALAMCAEGARGETALEMGQALRFPKALHRDGKIILPTPWDTVPIHAAVAALNRRFNGEAIGCELRVANALWVDRTCLLRKGYLETITKHYRGGVYGVDFKNDSRGAVRQINAWADKQTKGRIKDLLAEDSKLTKLVITNAIHFKGEWLEKFSADDTKDAPFTLANGDKAQVKTMGRRDSAKCRYGAFEADGSCFPTPAEVSFSGKQKVYPDNGFTLLEMPYKGDELSMVLIVPRSEKGLPAVEKLLSPANLTAWLGKLEKRAVHVHVPKFTMQTECDAKKALESLGMKRAFVDPLTAGGAQFEGMTASDDWRDKVFVSQVVHKAFVDVNEEGTEAAAATAAAMARSIGGPFTPTFRADRPFVFLIRDSKTGTVLFIGRVTDPRPKG
jgi:serpin B